MSSKITPRQRATMLFKQIRGSVPLKCGQVHTDRKNDYKRNGKHRQDWRDE
jgi:hypothetical protein